MKLRVLARLLQIQRVLLKYGLHDFVRATHLYAPLRFLFYLSPDTWLNPNRTASPAVRLRLALEELGPIFVKFGQAVSTRRDLLPTDVADELAKLQDRVPPFPGAVARAIVESAYGRPVSEAFSEFEETPLAAASIAQVHAARLPDGREVVVKVLRPDMRESIERDLEVLYALADLAQNYWRAGTAAAAARDRGGVREDGPRRAGSHARGRQCLTAQAQLRRLGPALRAGGLLGLLPPGCHGDGAHPWHPDRGHGAAARRRHRHQAARRERRAHLLHPGVPAQLLPRRHAPRQHLRLGRRSAQPRYAAVDFGIVGTLDPRDQHYLAANFLAVFDRDYRRVAELHVESGWVPAGTRVDEIESAVRTVCEPIFDRPLEDISFATLLVRLFEISRRFNVELQPQLILLQKTLVNVEGLGRELYPQLDVWHTAAPILREWMRERMSLRQILRNMRTQMPELIEAARVLPAILKSTLQRAEGGMLRMLVETPAVELLHAELRRGHKQRDAVILGAAALLGGIVWLALGREAWPGWTLAGCGAAWLLIVYRLF